MTFLNAALLFGALAAAVPLLIHLLHRTKTRVVHWAAMHFLAGAVQRKSRRIQWQQWLLLALRCAIPALLALAMAQPALTWLGGGLDRVSAQSHVLIDSSLSVLASIDDTPANLQLSDLPDSPNVAAVADRISDFVARPQILHGTSNPINQDSMRLEVDRSSLRQSIADRFTTPRQGFMQDLTTAIDQFEQTPDSPSQNIVVVATDFRQSLVSQITADERQRIRSLLSSSDAPSIVLLPLHPLTDKAQPRSNIAVHIDSTSDAVVGPKQTGKIEFTVGNFADQTAEDVVINVLLDGQPSATVRTDLAAGQIERRSVWLPSLPSGDHHCEIVVDRNDTFMLDNRAPWVVRSIMPQPVLLISGSNTDSSADFLQFAIAPPELDTADATQTETVLPRQLEILGPVLQQDRDKIDALLQRKPKHVILCDVSRLDEGLLAKIAESTANGSIVYLAGKNFDLDQFNQLREKYPELFPVEFEPGPRSISDQFVQFVQSANLPTTRNILGALANAESAVTLHNAWNLKFAPEATENATASQSNIDVLARNNDGKPLMLVGRGGQRITLVSAFDFHPTDTNLPVTDVFLPLIQGFYQSFIETQFGGRNVTCGAPLPESELNSPIPPAASLLWHVGIPSKSEQNTAPQPNDANALRISSLPNVFSAPSSDPKSSGPILAASQMPWADSDLTVVDVETARKFAVDLGCRLLAAAPTNIEASANIDSTNSPSITPRASVWRYVLFGLLLAMFGELFLQRHLSRSLAG